VHLAPAIVQQIYGAVKELDVIALEPELERLVTQALNSPHGAALDPGVADTLTSRAADTAKRQEDLGTAGLPAGARPDPRADGPPAQARRAAPEGAGAQRDS
jgi:flagellar biosynthesis protein FlhA